MKDEGGEIGFVAVGVPLARSDRRGAAVLQARARWRGSRTANGVYLIGRVVFFQDP